MISAICCSDFTPAMVLGGEKVSMDSNTLDLLQSKLSLHPGTFPVYAVVHIKKRSMTIMLFKHDSHTFQYHTIGMMIVK